MNEIIVKDNIKIENLIYEITYSETTPLFGICFGTVS